VIKFLKKLERYFDECFFEMLDGKDKQSWTYSEYIDDMRKCAYQLDMTLNGIEGKHIGIIANSDYEYFVMLAAIMFGRGVAVPLNERETQDYISYAISKSDVDAIIVADDIKQFTFDNIIVINKSNLFTKDGGKLELIDFDDDEKDKLILIIHTSGTTGLPKGVALTADNLFHDYKTSLLKVYVDNGLIVQGFRCYFNFPFYHVAGLILFLCLPVYGGTGCCSKKPANVLSDLEHHKVDIAGIIPSVLGLWETCIRRGRIDRLGGVKAVITGGAPIDPSIVNFFKTNGITVGQFYGLTEVGWVATVNLEMDKHPDSIGVPVEDAQVIIQDGEICIKYWGNMKGYYNDPDDTEKVLKDGFIYSGDLGYIDKDGYIYITGRKKNLIILSGGENVSPEEIEAKLYRNTKIQECLVYEQNDRIVADVYAPGLTESDLKQYVSSVNASMPIYKRISKAMLKDEELKKSSFGKIKR
jgi:long-chain acyl-CoA synthetase